MSIHLVSLCSTDTLTELIRILQPMSDAVYLKQLRDERGELVSSIGDHCRHILEFYQCFFQGLAEGTIDYDARCRNPHIEQNKIIALANLDDICSMLSRLPTTSYPKATLILRAQVDSELAAMTTRTSIERELVFLQSHSTHHLALIAMLLNSYGQSAPASCGLATSTRSYRNQQKVN